MKKLLLTAVLALTLAACQTVSVSKNDSPSSFYNIGPSYNVTGIPSECAGLGPYSDCISSYRRYGYNVGGHVAPMGTIQAPYISADTIRTHSNKRVCDIAIERNTAVPLWVSNKPYFWKWVIEAKNRNLSIQQCAKITGRY